MVMDAGEPGTREMREQIERMFAAALRNNVNHETKMQRLDGLHIAETERRDELHVDEIERRDELHVDELEQLNTALDSRDIIGQAKGVMMVTMGCSAEQAFGLLRAQAQHEDRELADVAADVAAHAQRWRPSADQGK